MILHGIELRPGMVLQNDNNDVVVVIPHETCGIAFVSYNLARNWSTRLNIVISNVSIIRDCPCGDGLTDGKILWRNMKFEVKDSHGVYTMDKEQLKAYINETVEPFSVHARI